MLKNIFYQIYSLLYLLPGFGQEVNPQILGRLDNQLAECSGIAILPSGNLAMINDSGNPPEVFITDQKGNILHKMKVDFATNRDWEEVVYADGLLYIGDFGNNANKRQDLKIYRLGIIEPDSLFDAGEITFRYARQQGFPPKPTDLNYDMEAMVYSNDSLFLFSKNRTLPFTGYTYLYGLPDKPGDYTLAPLDSFKTGEGLMHLFWVAGAALDEESKTLALMGYDKLWLFYDFPGNHFFKGENQTFHFDKLTQKEALAFSDSENLLITDEQNPIGGGNIYRAKIPAKSDTQGAEDTEIKVEEVFPKEFQDSLTLQFSAATEENIYWEFFNTHGERILFGTIKDLNEKHRHHISTSELPPGGYVLNIIIREVPNAYKLKKLYREE